MILCYYNIIVIYKCQSKTAYNSEKTAKKALADSLENNQTRAKKGRKLESLILTYLILAHIMLDCQVFFYKFYRGSPIMALTEEPQ